MIAKMDSIFLGSALVISQTPDSQKKEAVHDSEKNLKP
jgi:hypothetical protein